MRKTALSIWSISWVIASILFLCTTELALAASKEAKKDQGKTQKSSAKQNKRMVHKIEMGPEGITAYYSEGWSAAPSANLYTILKVPTEQRGKLDAAAIIGGESCCFILT